MSELYENLKKGLEEDPRTADYSLKEVEDTIEYIESFINRLKQVKVIENNEERELNQLELFIAINELVANRVYEDNINSHDIVGVCTSGKAVCEGFCKMTQLLCKQFGIKTLYKHSVPYDEQKQPVSEGHGNMEIFIKDKNGNLHCLHYDPTIDCLKDKESMTYNTTLIPDENIQKYQYTQQWTPPSNATWEDLAKGVFLEEQDQKLTPSYMDEILGTDRLGRFRPDLIEMANCMELEYDSDLSTKEQCLELYAKLIDKYQQAKLPIENKEFLEALVNVQKAMLLYNTRLSMQEINETTRKTLKDRVELSKTMQQNVWSKECKSSFIVDIVNGEFNYEEELEKLTPSINTQSLGRETLTELNDTTYLDETEKQEQRDIENMQNRGTQEK